MSPRGLSGVVALLLVGWAPPAAAIAPGPPVAVGGATDTASCLHATGAPGQVLLQAPAARDFATDVRGEAGVTGTVRLGAQTACAEGAAGGGRLLVAAPVSRGGTPALRASFGPRSRSHTVATAGPLTSYDAVRVAVGPGGHAAIAWVETTRPRTDRPDPLVTRRARLARASPTGPFAAPVTVSRSRGPESLGQAEVALGVDGAGGVTLVTAEPRRPVRVRLGTLEDLYRLIVRTAAPGVLLGGAQVLDGQRQGPLGAQLSVAADGSALLAADGSSALTAWSRAADDGALRPLLTVEERRPDESVPAPRADGAQRVEATSAPSTPAVVAGPGQTGAVAWRLDDQATAAITVSAGGVVGAPRTVSRGIALPDILGLLQTFSSPLSDEPSPLFEITGSRPSLAMTPGGRLALGVTRAPREDGQATALAAFGSLAEGLRPARAITGPARTAIKAVAVVGADGAPEVVVADENGDRVDATLRPNGRVAAVRDAAPAAPAPPPAARVVGPRRVTVRGARPFPVRIRCAAACDIRVDVPGRDDPLVVGDSLAGAGTATLRLTDGDRPITGRRRALRLRVRVAAPGSLRARTLRATLALRVLPRLPAPRIVVLSVRRRASSATVVLAAPGELQGLTVTGNAAASALASGTARRMADGRYRILVPITTRTRRITLFAFSPDLGRASLRRDLRLPAR